MSLNVSKLVSACQFVLLDHIGVAAYPVTQELVAAYLEKVSAKAKPELAPKWMPWIFFHILSEKLPASLPILEIELAISTAYNA
jgi:hypothetical protein